MRSRLTLVSSLLMFFLSSSTFADKMQMKKEEEQPSSSQRTAGWLIGSIALVVAGYFGYHDFQEWRKTVPNEPKKRPPKGHGHKRSTASVSFSSGASSDGMLIPRGEPVQMPVRPILRSVAQELVVNTEPADRIVLTQIETGLELEITRSTRIVELLNPASETIVWEKLSSLANLDELARFFKDGTCVQSDEVRRLIRRIEEKGFKALPNSDLPC